MALVGIGREWAEQVGGEREIRERPQRVNVGCLEPHDRLVGESVDEILEHLRNALPSRYTIEREIGRGGMATVYLAMEDHPNREVAVKVPSPEFATHIMRRCLDSRYGDDGARAPGKGVVIASG